MVDTKNICGQKKHMSKIFVCVPTMNDSEFLSTVERALDHSSNPDNLSIATTIFWKNSDLNNEKNPFFIKIKNILDKNFKNVKYDIQPWSLHPGVGHGRISPTKFFNNEKYFLSIDSHTDFKKNWDDQVIDLYENSREYFGRLRVLTSYLSAYKRQELHDNNQLNNTFYPEIDLANRWQFFDFYKNLGDKALKSSVFPLPNDQIMNEDNLGYLSKYLIDNEYIPAKKISAHFYFTESSPWLTKHNLNLNKNIKFWAEEFYQSSLAYARGYNLVWYKTQILYHQYEASGGKREYEKNSLDNFSSMEEKLNILKEYVEKSINYSNVPDSLSNDKNIIMQLLEGHNKNFGYLPRSIKGFLKYGGIDVVNKKISPWWKVPDINVVYK
jgi:hypothetical protein